MPHVIVSTVALLSNLYKNAPLIVGDKDSDPDLMRYLGARMTTNYPTCGSPPMYVLHAPPRTVFDNLEKRGYCLMAAQTIQEHAVWVLARPRVPDDDKTEIQRGGPNDKAIQANGEEVVENSGNATKPAEKLTSEASVKKTSNEPVDLTAGRTAKFLIADDHSLSDSEINASKGDHAHVKSLSPNRNLSPNDKMSAEIMNRRNMALNNTIRNKSLVGIGVGDDLSNSILLLDGCTQTRFGEVIWTASIPKLPKVIDGPEYSSSPPNEKESFISFGSLIAELRDDSTKPTSNPCGAPLPPLLEANPIFANLADRTHLNCLTQCEGCCCEE